MFSKHKKIEDILVDLLVSGPKETVVLIEKVQKSRPKTTKQAVYKILKKLRDDEIVIHKKSLVVLSSAWLNKLSQFVEKAHVNYKTAERPGVNFLKLKEGEKMSYTFQTFEATDMFWVHAFDVLFDMIPVTTPVLISNPHEWFLLARTESELFLLERFKKTGKKLFLIAGGQTKLDLFVNKYFDGISAQYMPSKEHFFPKRNYYVNVFGDFLIEVWLDPKVSAHIDSFYNKTTIFDTSAKNKLLEVITQKGKNKFVITKNKRKAEKIRSVFKKYFLFPKQSSQ